MIIGESFVSYTDLYYTPDYSEIGDNAPNMLAPHIVGCLAQGWRDLIEKTVSPSFCILIMVMAERSSKLDTAASSAEHFVYKRENITPTQLMSLLFNNLEGNKIEKNFISASRHCR